jgi:tetratricopeptide (TPR) repeat protein
VLVASGNGYLLSADHTQLDHLAFRFLVDRARRDRANQRLTSAFSAYQRAVELWRGNPLDDLPALQADPAVAALTRQQQAAILECADVARILGRHEDVLPMLHRLTEANPLHEPAHSRLMIALAGLGRQAEALQVYNTLRDRLVDDLGLDPVTELREAHQAILRGDLDGSYLAVPPPSGAPESPAPRTSTPAITIQEPLLPTQIPAGPRGFVGREEQLAALDAVRPLPDMTTVVISGTAGAGKTALAVHWARRVADEFPDGQLFADLGGFGPAPAPAQPTDILRGFLEALGVPADRIPARPADRAALYRSRLAGKRTLVVLDNARDADQVRSLLPGSPGCLALVTSRHKLTGLVVIEAAHSVTVDAMTPAEARALLRRRLGTHRTAPNARGVDVIAERCARLPLALAIASATVATSPALALPAFADQLAADTVLDTLRVDGPTTDLRTVFSWSYRALSPGAARLFVRLGAGTRSEVDLAAVAELAGEPVDQVIPPLAELTSTHLVRELPYGRYAMHDLLRAYAAELAANRAAGLALQGVA